VTYRIAIPLVVVPLLVVLAQVNFLLFHVAAELFAAVVGVLLFFVAAITLRWSRDGLFYVLGAGYFWIACADLLHTLAYKGMGVFPLDSANPAPQYWIGTRLLEGLLLLAAPGVIGRRAAPMPIFIGFAGLFAVLVSLIESGVFPAAYVDGVGLTPFKVGAEYVVIALLGLAWLRFHSRRAALPAGLYRTLALAIGLTAGAELAFTFYVGVYDLSNMVGHLFKFLSFWLLFLAAERLLLTTPLRAMATDSATLGALADPVLLVDGAGRVVQANEPARAAFALHGDGRAEDLHAVGPLRAVAEDDCPLCAAIRELRPLRDLEVQDPDTGRWHLIDAQPTVGAGSAQGMVVQIRDITDTRRLRDQVREEKMRADMALTNSELGTWDWSVTTGRVAFSDRMMTMLGYTPGDWAPHEESWAALVHPDDLPAVKEALKAHLEGRTETYDTVHRLRRKDGSYAWIRDIGRVVERDADGRPLRAIGTHADVTEAKELELGLQRSNQDLEQFAYAVSHDLQEPLRMVGGFLGILRRRYRGDLPEEAREFVDRAIDGAERMGVMIRDLLDVSRVHTKGQTFRRVPLGEALAEARRNLDSLVAETGGHIAAPDGPPVLWADRSQIVRLLQNLLANALKYRRDGVPPVISVSARRLGDTVALEVADNGVGIPEEDRERMFQPFQRLAGTATPGSGIGLTLCRRIVDRHGGTITLDGNADGGTTVRFALPAASDDAAPAAPATPEAVV